jgi:hypothetical protein
VVSQSAKNTCFGQRRAKIRSQQPRNVFRCGDVKLRGELGVLPKAKSHHKQAGKVSQPTPGGATRPKFPCSKSAISHYPCRQKSESSRAFHDFRRFHKAQKAGEWSSGTSCYKISPQATSQVCCIGLPRCVTSYFLC